VVFEGFVASCFAVFYPVSGVSRVGDGVFSFSVSRGGGSVRVFVSEGGSPPSGGVVIDLLGSGSGRVDSLLSVRGGSLGVLRELLSRGVYGVVPSRSPVSFSSVIEERGSIVVLRYLPIFHVFLLYRVSFRVSSGVLFRREKSVDGWVIVDPLCLSSCRLLRDFSLDCVDVCVDSSSVSVESLVGLSRYSGRRVSESELSSIVPREDVYRLSLYGVLSHVGGDYYRVSSIKPVINTRLSLSRIESIPMEWSNFSFSCSRKYQELIYIVDRYIGSLYKVVDRGVLLVPFIGVVSPIGGGNSIRAFNVVSLKEDNYISRVYTQNKRCIIDLINTS